MLLVSGVNYLAAGLTLLGLFSYVILYTVILNPRTTKNIVFGGVAGAIPPIVGAWKLITKDKSQTCRE